MTLITCKTVNCSLIAHWFISGLIRLSLTVCAVVQTPAAALAFIISVVVQRDSVGVYGYQTWTLSTAQLYGVSVWNSYLLRHEYTADLLYNISV